MNLARRLFIPLFALILTACPYGGNDDYEFDYETIVTDVPANLIGINSPYDDYNSDLPYPYTIFSLFFSSNRPSEGQYFDITLGRMDLSYHEKDDVLDVHSGYPANLTIYENSLLTLIRSSHNQLGPHTFAGPVEFSYFFYADDLGGDYDIRFVHYLKSDWLYAGGTNTLYGPDSLRVINSDKDELYPSIPDDLSSLYFCSNRSNDIFDIYSVPLPEADSLHAYFKDTVAVEPERNEVLSSDFNDKCPFIYEDIMVFASDREGGFGGFDLYFSRRVNGTWTDPVNFGPKINTEYDEYRPILISFYQTQNDLMIFSSNRPGGQGGFDLYILNADSYIHP